MEKKKPQPQSALQLEMHPEEHLAKTYQVAFQEPTVFVLITADKATHTEVLILWLIFSQLRKGVLLLLCLSILM